MNDLNNLKNSKWYHRSWFVVLMLIAFGPFAFPLLWKSSSFNKPLKWFLTALFTVLTVLALWGSVETFKLVWKQFEDLRAVLL